MDFIWTIIAIIVAIIVFFIGMAILTVLGVAAEIARSQYNSRADKEDFDEL